ncbi:MAG: hypothetical protein Q9160_005014 [Pyrenula sp. 1 TL-2023]
MAHSLHHALTTSPYPPPTSAQAKPSSSYFAFLLGFDQRFHDVAAEIVITQSQLMRLMLSPTYTRDAIALTHEQVIVALATLQSSVQDLSRAYINHANTVLGPGSRGPTLDLGLTTTLLEGGLLTGAARQPSPGAAQDQPAGKKKRKRAPPDPNAPKRALTPYFLFMSSARARIAEELGSNMKPKEIADEGTRRWASMPDAEKQVWNSIYQENLAIYRIKMKAYKEGKTVPSDDEAKTEFQALGGVEAVAKQAESEEEEEEEPSPEPPKVPSPPTKTSKRRKAEKPSTPAAKEPTPPPPSTKKSEKSKKKKKDEPAPAPAAPAAEPKSDKKKKKTKKA